MTLDSCIRVLQSHIHQPWLIRHMSGALRFMRRDGTSLSRVPATFGGNVQDAARILSGQSIGDTGSLMNNDLLLHAYVLLLPPHREVSLTIN